MTSLTSPKTLFQNVHDEMNNLNFDDAESVVDNTQVPGYDNSTDLHHRAPPRRSNRGNRKNTSLSIIEKELKEAKRLIESKLETDGNEQINKKKGGGRNGFDRNPDFRTSETEAKTPYVPLDEGSPTQRKKSEKVYARNVQEGNRNLMLIYEPKESKSGVYSKQIGNKNIMVHLHVSSNLCQLIDRDNLGVIPLDSEGEVWLEIKRRSQVLKRGKGRPDSESTVSSASTSLTDLTSEDTNMFDKSRQWNQYVPNITSSYAEGKIPRSSATENSDSDESVECDPIENEDESPYPTISCIRHRDSLMMKFEKWNQHGVLNPNNVSESPILSHKKVIDFLNDEGNDFDVSICEWGYEKESVYSYISSHPNFGDMNDDHYTTVTPVRTRVAGEHSIDSFGQCLDNNDPYDLPQTLPLGNDLYSKVNKPVNNHGAKPPEVTPRPKIGTARAAGVEIYRSVSDPAYSTPHELAGVTGQTSVQRESYPKTKQNAEQKKPDIHVRTKKIELSDHKWYHGPIEKTLAKERLNGLEHGSFLVRDASNNSTTTHKYTIEFIDEDTVKKLMIMKTSSKYHFNEYEDKKFDRVDQLIHTIIEKGLEVKDTATNSWKNIKVKPVAHP